MSGTGFFSFPHIKKVPWWIAGQEIATTLDPLRAAYVTVYPASMSGVSTPLGWVHQSSTPSEKAPSQASRLKSWNLAIAPILSDVTALHLEAVIEGGEFARIQMWSPIPLPVTWLITAARTTYSTPYTISGSAGVRGLYFEPIVEIRDGGKFIEALSFVASSPSSTEFTLTSITADSRAILVGDLSAHVDKQLQAWVYALHDVRILGGSTIGLVDLGRWEAALNMVSAPSPFDYEAD